MSKLPLLFLLTALGVPALAATPASVEQVEQLLCSVHKQADAKVARKLSGLELTERAGTVRLGRWQADFPGKKTREALLALADEAAFLDLPSAEIAALAMPDRAALQQILARTVDYVNTTTRKLPNFSAKRSTIHFEDLSEDQLFIQNTLNSSPGFYNSSRPGASSSAGFKQMRVVDRSSIVVTYRDGHEVAARAKYEKQAGSQGLGLTTSGEFGPILSTVLGDAVRGKIYWGYWEGGGAAPLAVFRYAVPQERSHYSVLVGFVGTGNKPQFPAYHGEITIDPASGAILRLTMVSETKRSNQTLAASLLVEYGPVTIGDATYICPLRGVALSKIPTGGDGSTEPITPPITFLNDVSFTQYHLFRADTRILPEYDARPH